jgi:hypothetical protein
MLCSEGLIFTSAPGLFFELCPFFVAGVVFCRIGHFFIRVAWHFLHIAKTLAGAGQNERCSWRSFRVAGAVFGEFGRRLERVEIAFCEIVFEFDLGHDDEFV